MCNASRKISQQDSFLPMDIGKTFLKLMKVRSNAQEWKSTRSSDQRNFFFLLLSIAHSDPLCLPLWKWSKTASQLRCVCFPPEKSSSKHRQGDYNTWWASKFYCTTKNNIDLHLMFRYSMIDIQYRLFQMTYWRSKKMKKCAHDEFERFLNCQYVLLRRCLNKIRSHIYFYHKTLIA